MRLSGGIAIIVSVGALALWSGNIRARSWGGSQEVVLSPGRKLVTTTWNGADLWYLTREVEAGERPVRWRFAESSAFGIFEGDVIFIEVDRVDRVVATLRASAQSDASTRDEPAPSAQSGASYREVHIDVGGHTIDATMVTGRADVLDIRLAGALTPRDSAAGRAAVARVLEYVRANP